MDPSNSPDPAGARLIEILGEGGADRLGHPRDVSITRMFEADEDARARRLEGRSQACGPAPSSVFI